jgi:membrane protein YdbS with pleckstrin-like domain
MNALHRYLANDEQVVVEVRRHPAVLAAPVLTAFAVIVAGIVVGIFLTPASTHDFVDTVAGLVVLFFILRAGWRVWEWWADRIVVSDRRIFEISGILTRTVASMPVERVTDMTYKRTIFGRLLGFGEIIVESAGQEQGLSSIDHIPHPDEFYRTITSLVTAGLPAVEEGGSGPYYDEDDTGPLPRVTL